MNQTLLKADFNELERIFSNRTEAFTPRIMGKVFGALPEVDGEMPEFLTSERLKKLHKMGIAPIVFVPKTAKEITEQFGNKQSNGKKLMYNISWYKEEPCWTSEKPRTGICLVSMGCIPNSKGINFMEQTKILADFVEKVFPELKDTDFFRGNRIEMEKAEKEVNKLMNASKYKDAVSILQKLKINQYFRPRFPEAHQQMVAFDKENSARLYENEYTWTNSAGVSSEELVGVGGFDDEGVGVGAGHPGRYWDDRGVSFLCSLKNLILEI